MKNRKLWILDLILYCLFLLSFFVDVTGVAMHQWLGIAVGAFAMIHLLLHWNWVKNLLRNKLSDSSRQMRWNSCVDLATALGLITLMGTGLLMTLRSVSEGGSYAAIRVIHIASSLMTLVSVTVKVSLHWKWILATFKKFLPKETRATQQPLNQSRVMGRREFLGIFGASSLIIVFTGAAIAWDIKQTSRPSSTLDSSFGTSTDASLASENDASPIKETISIPAVVSSANSNGETPVESTELVPASLPTPSIESGPVIAAESSNSTSCFLQYNRGCSYPGRCGRYTDTNQDNRCDRSECL